MVDRLRVVLGAVCKSVFTGRAFTFVVFATTPVFGALVQYPTSDGEILDYGQFVEALHAAGALAVVAADPLALTLLRPPGEFGADVVVGSAQRFGVLMGYGGPHAGYMATKDAYKRPPPGPPDRRLQGLVGQAGDAPVAAGPRAAHPP